VTTPAHNSHSVELGTIEVEDGDAWFIWGHHGDEDAIAAVNRAIATYDGEPVDQDTVTVTRGHWRDAHDPTNDERWDRCQPDDEGAEPFTYIEL